MKTCRSREVVSPAIPALQSLVSAAFVKVICEIPCRCFLSMGMKTELYKKRKGLAFWKLQSTITSCLFVPNLILLLVEGTQSHGLFSRENIRAGGKVGAE